MNRKGIIIAPLTIAVSLLLVVCVLELSGLTKVFEEKMGNGREIASLSDLLSIATYELEFIETPHIEEKTKVPGKYLVKLQKGEKNVTIDDKKLYEYIQEENIQKGDILKIELEGQEKRGSIVKYNVKNVLGKLEK